MVLDAGIDDHLGANAARQVGAVEGGAADADPMIGRLNDGVLLGVDPAAQLVALAGRDVELRPQTAGLGAVGHPGGRSVVAGGQDAFVLDQHRAPPPAARRWTVWPRGA